MGRTQRGSDSSLSIETVLERSREKDIIEARRHRIERLRVTEWRIWKLLRIDWQ